MKIALITDLHAGHKNNNKIFNDYFIKFYQEVFFPYLEQNKIKDIICLGDVFDNRKVINLDTLSSWRKNIFEPINEKYQTHIILGNHDCYHSNTTEVNSVSELLYAYQNIYIIDKPIELQFDKTKILCIPWINKSNEDDCLVALKQSKCKILMGHFDILGFQFQKNNFNTSVGFDPSNFKKFSKVLSGHYHHKSDDGKIFYLGSPYEMLSCDLGCERGFHILDTETTKLEFIQNPYKIYHKIIYDDKKYNNIEDMIPDNINIYKDCYVKILIKNKNNPVLYDSFINKIEAENPFHVDPIEVKIEESLNEEFELDEHKDIVDIFKDYIVSSNIENDYKDEVLNKILSLYKNSLEIEL